MESRRYSGLGGFHKFQRGGFSSGYNQQIYQVCARITGQAEKIKLLLLLPGSQKLQDLAIEVDVESDFENDENDDDDFDDFELVKMLEEC